MKSFDLAGHLKIAVADYDVSSSFYKKVFEILGYKLIKDTHHGCGWVTPYGFGIYLASAEIDTKPLLHGAPGLHHLCLKATSTKAVDDAYEWALRSGVRIFNPPTRYPRYTDDYYAVFLSDPDGIKVEIALY